MKNNMNKSLITASQSIAAIVAVIFVAAAVDTNEYRSAVKAFASETVQTHLETLKEETESDLNRYSVCTSMRLVDPVTQVYSNTPKVRECLIANAPKTQTATGALVFASSMSVWLETHEGDKEVTDAAMQAINNGRSALLAMKPWYYDGLSKIRKANDKSFFRRLIFGEKNAMDLFVSMSDSLSKAEYQVLSPAAARRQADWLIKALGSK